MSTTLPGEMLVRDRLRPRGGILSWASALACTGVGPSRGRVQSRGALKAPDREEWHVVVAVVVVGVGWAFGS